MTEQESVSTPEVTEVQPTVVVAQDLLHQINALKAITTAHSLINDARYPHTLLEAVKSSLQFLESLHGQALNQALSHPDAGKVPELAEIFNQRSVTNGQV
jgi:hypothetical protein